MSAHRLIVSGLLVAAAAVAADAQEITSVTRSEGTVGDTLVLDGSDLGDRGKPKVFLTLASPDGGKGARRGKTPKIKLKVRDSDPTSIRAELKRVSKKAVTGVYDLHVKPKGGDEILVEDAFRLVPPSVDAVTPDAAQPGDVVSVSVRDYGSKGKHRASVGMEQARIRSETDHGDGSWTIEIEVPRIGNGVWPVCIENQLGVGVLKGALDVSGSATSAGDAPTQLEISGLKTFKAKPDMVATDEQPGPETNIGAIGGKKKKPQVLGVSLDSALADVQPGDSFDGSSALIQFNLTRKKGTEVDCSWTTTSNRPGESFSIEVTARDEECIVLFVCGTIRKALGDGPECIDVLGTVKAPASGSVKEPPKSCDPLTTAQGSLTGAFVSEPIRNIGLAGVSGPGSFKFSTGTVDNLQGVPEAVLTWTVSFDPRNTPLPATYDSISLTGGGLTEFSMELADTTFFSQRIDPQLSSSMSVTITEVVNVPSNPDGILACIRGTFTGTLHKSDPQMTPQSFSGSFEIPWYDIGFGQ